MQRVIYIPDEYVEKHKKVIEYLQTKRHDSFSKRIQSLIDKIYDEEIKEK